MEDKEISKMRSDTPFLDVGGDELRWGALRVILVQSPRSLVLARERWTFVNWSGRQDSNLRPRGPEPRALPV